MSEAIRPPSSADRQGKQGDPPFQGVRRRLLITVNVYCFMNAFYSSARPVPPASGNWPSITDFSERSADYSESFQAGSAVILAGQLQ